MHPRSAHKLWDPPGGIANTSPCPVVEFQEVSCPSPPRGALLRLCRWGLAKLRYATGCYVLYFSSMLQCYVVLVFPDSGGFNWINRFRQVDFKVRDITLKPLTDKHCRIMLPANPSPWPFLLSVFAKPRRSSEGDETGSNSTSLRGRYAGHTN